MKIKMNNSPAKATTIRKIIQKLFTNESPRPVLPAPDKIPGKPVNDKDR